MEILFKMPYGRAEQTTKPTFFLSLEIHNVIKLI